MVALLFGGALVSGCSDSQVMDLEAASFVSGIEIEPSWAIIAPGGEQQFVAQVRDESGEAVSGGVQWSTSDADIVEVDASGRVVGVSEGSASLMATYHGVTEKITVDVKGEVAGLKLSYASLTLDEGQTTQLQTSYVYANGVERPARRVRWWSSDASVIEVDPSGQVRAVKSGTAFIAVRGRDKKAPHLQVVVRPAQVGSVHVGGPTSKLRPGGQLQLWADVYDHAGNHLEKSVRWSSSNASVAQVSSDGNVSGRRPGQATITATSGSATGSFAVEVTSPAAADAERGRRPTRVDDLAVVSMTDTEATLRFTEVGDGTGGPAKYEVRFGRSPWRGGWGAGHPVSKGTCAGPVQGAGAGKSLTCTVEGLQPKIEYEFQVLAYLGPTQPRGRHGPPSRRARGRTESAPLQVEVLPSEATLEMGEELQLRAELTDAYGDQIDRAVTPSSTRTSVATVTPSGVVKAMAAGEAEIRATAEGIVGSSRVHVIAAKFSGSESAGVPSGYQWVTKNAWDKLEGGGWSTSWNNAGLARTVEDDSAPTSCCSVLEHLYPKGFTGGTAPGTLNFELSSPRGIYISTWWKARSDWQTHNSGIDKLIFVFSQANGHSMSIIWHFGGSFRVAPSKPGGWQWLTSNIDSEALRSGRWYHIEWLLEHEGGRNWAVKWWVDGSLRGDHSGVPWTGAPLSTLKLSPTWGGIGDTKVKDDYFRWDHMQIAEKK